MPTTPIEPPGFPAEIPSPPKLPLLHQVMIRCTRCDLSLSRTKVVPGDGNHQARLMFIGEAPGFNEDRVGLPFVGASGKLLNAMLETVGMNRDDVFIANVVRCRPPNNRNPKAAEIRACAGWLAEQIRLIEPRLVAPLGRYALEHFIRGGKITKLKGELHPIKYNGRPLDLFPLLHPAAILRAPDRRPEYQEDFGRLRTILDEG